MLGYIGAIRHIGHVLDSRQYDGIIFLETHSAVACSWLLNKRYEKKFIVEVRDYTYEHLPLYRAIEKQLFRKAAFVAISSDAYKHFLPEGEYVLAHNLSFFDEKDIQDQLNRRRGNNDCYELTFVGTIRFLDINKRLLDTFKNDSRFILAYYGVGSDELKRYCIGAGIHNVKFGGAFPKEKTLHMYENASIINNVYGSNDPRLDYALSNKLYHAAQLRLPILVSQNTYMEEVTRQYGLGLSINWNDTNIPDSLFKQLKSLDYKALEDGCNSFLAQCESDNAEYYERIHRFIVGDD